MNAPSIFSPNNITMSSREIAELVESRHDSVKRTIERCTENGAITSPPLVETSFTGIDGRKQTVSVYNLDKRSSLIVVAQLSPEFTARIVDRWQELEQKLVNPAQPTVTQSLVVEALCAAEVLARMLNASESGKLTMARLAFECVGANHLVPMLPVYAIDAPIGAAGASSEPTASLSALLKEHGIPISAKKANILLEHAGLLQEMTRKSGTDGVKRFWAITDDGLAYGKNVTSPSNPKETKPHWYRSKFHALLERIGLI